MKNLIVFLPILFYSFAVKAQNYQCVQANARHFFVNRGYYGYLRGIRIDSTKQAGNDLILYPFHSPRGIYLNNATLDINGGSWLGKKITIKPNGMNLFENMVGDTIVINTGAQLGDSWIFYNDTSSIYFEASITVVDTMTILGGVDSIKRIKLTAKNGPTVVASEPANNLELVFSKNNGFVQAIDLCTFPYHGQDYYRDKSGGLGALFKLINLPNTTKWDIYNFNIGDVFCRYGDGVGGTKYIFDTVTNKTIAGNTATYTYHTKTNLYNHSTYQWSSTLSTHQNAIVNGPFLDTSLMPEETGAGQFIFFDPLDTTNCVTGAMYSFADNFIFGDHINTFEPCGQGASYKTSLGRVKYSICYDPTPGQQYGEDLKGIYRNGNPCGFLANVSVSETTKSSAVRFYPNPASEVLNIDPGIPGENTISMYSTDGRLVKSVSVTDKHQINVQDLSPGIYYLKVQAGIKLNCWSKIEIRR